MLSCCLSYHLSRSFFHHSIIASFIIVEIEAGNAKAAIALGRDLMTKAEKVEGSQKSILLGDIYR
jgi:hypothetical protein